MDAATFERMRAGADRLVPGGGVLKSSAAFFRRGSSGAGQELLTDGEFGHYLAPAAQLAPPDLLAWLQPRGDVARQAGIGPPLASWRPPPGKLAS